MKRFLAFFVAALMLCGITVFAEETGTEQEIVFGIEMSNYKGWAPFQQGTNTTMHVGDDGILNVEFAGTSSYAPKNINISFTADSVGYIEVSMKAEKNLGNIKFYYATASNAAIDESKTFTSAAIAASTEFKTVRIPVQRINTNFKGTVNNLRMDFNNPSGVSGNSIQIEYIRFCNDTLSNPAGSEYTRVHSIPIHAWEMDSAWWSNWGGITTSAGTANGAIPVTNGHLIGTYPASSTNWYINQASTVSDLSCDDISYVEMSVSSSNALERIEVSLGSGKVLRSGAIASGAGQKIIRMENKDENGNPYTGAADALQFRFIPAERSLGTNIDIDYIRLCKTEQSDPNLTSVKKTDDEIVYDFTVNEPDDGWRLNGKNKYIRGGVIGASGTANETSYAETCAALDYDATEMGNVSITYKNSSSANTAKLYYKTDGDADWSEQKSVEFRVKPNDDGFTTYTVYPQWTGTVTGLCFALLNGEGSFEIDEISLSKYRQEIAFGLEMSNYKGWAPFQEGSNTKMHVGDDGILNAEFSGTESYAYKNTDIVFSADSVDYIEVSMKAEKNLNNIIFYYLTDSNTGWDGYKTISSAAVAASEEFQTVRIPVDRKNNSNVRTNFKGTVNNLRMDFKNPTGVEGNSVQIEYIRFCKDTLPNPAGSEYTRVHSFPTYAWEMDSVWWKNWGAMTGKTGDNASVSNGHLVGGYPSTDTNWYINQPSAVSGLSCDDISYAEMSLSSTNVLDHIEFALGSGAVLKSGVIAAGSEQKIIRMENKDENGNPYTGAANNLQIRFIPVERSLGTNIDIDYIRFYKTEDHGASVKKTDDEIVYDFTVNKSDDGWSLNGKNKYIRDGAIGASGTADAISYAETCAALDYDVTNLRNISITYKNASSADTAKLYYKTDDDADYSEAKSVEFTVNPNDDGFATYTLYPQWTGTVTGLRFALLNGEGSFEIDKISLSKYSAVRDVQWKNAAGETVTELAPGAEIKPTITVERANPGSAEVFVALYGQDGNLVQAGYESLTFDEAGTQTTPDMAVTVPDTGSGYTAKVIVLDSMATLNPMRWRAAAANNRALPIAQQ